MPAPPQRKTARDGPLPPPEAGKLPKREKLILRLRFLRMSFLRQAQDRQDEQDSPSTELGVNRAGLRPVKGSAEPGSS